MNNPVYTSILKKEFQDLVELKRPIFADIVLADEINRASPRTQSALLEAMAEPELRGRVAENARQMVPENGAERAADFLLEWLERG